MTHFLLLDFGTTSTKSTLVDLDSGEFTPPESHSALANRATRPGRSEFDPLEVHQRFEAICARYYARTPFAGIALCSEMHGFVVLDEQDKPLTHYISWKDERSLEPAHGESAFDAVLNAVGDRFTALTGMKARPGFAPMNFLHLSREVSLPPTVRIVDLPGWLCRAGGHSTGYAHPTMLAGLALYDVQQGTIAEELVETVQHLSASRVLLDAPADTGQVAGYWDAGARRVPIYVGIGDHQCSLLGAGLVSTDSLSINLGTGAQVSTLYCPSPPVEAETRPYFSDRMLRTITHIPGGRALAEYIGFLGEIGEATTDFWQLLAACRVEDVQASTMQFGLGLFPGARAYDGGGYIRSIGEGELTLKNYLCSLLKAFVEQYVDVLRLFDPMRQMQAVLLSGGIARRLPIVGELVQIESDYPTQEATALDESLIGLRAVALAAHQQTDALSAQPIWGRTCRTTVR